MKLQIVGPGCGRCLATEVNVRQAVKELNLDAEVSHVFDIKEFAKLGVRLTPAVLVDGKVVVSGKIPSAEEVKKLLQA